MLTSGFGILFLLSEFGFVTVQAAHYRATAPFDIKTAAVIVAPLYEPDSACRSRGRHWRRGN